MGNGWFGTVGTTVTMSGAGAQPTNVVVHSPVRLTFVTPARARRLPSNVYSSRSRLGLTPDDQLHLRGPHRSGVPGARKPAFSYDGQHVAFESRYALLARRHQRPDRHLRPQPDQRRGAPGQRVVDRRPGARRREHQPGDQRQRPLRRLPVAGDQPGAGRHQRPDGHLRPRPRRRRQRHLRRGGQGPHRARQPRPEPRRGPGPHQAARRRQRRSGHQRERPLRRVPLGGHQPARRRRHQRA